MKHTLQGLAFVLLAIGLPLGVAGAASGLQSEVDRTAPVSKRSAVVLPDAMVKADALCSLPGPRGEDLSDYYRLCASLALRPAYGDGKNGAPVGTALVTDCRSYLAGDNKDRREEYADCLTQNYPGK